MIAKVTSHGFQRNSHDFQWNLQDLPRISSRNLLDFPWIFINFTKFRARARSQGAPELVKFSLARAAELLGFIT